MKAKLLNKLRIGTAGWAIPAAVMDAFPPGGPHLNRYATVFDCVEINSSFHRPHRISTYQRWAASVPDGFRFSVKVPKEITHVRRLSGSEILLDTFLAEVAGLADRLGPLLFQLPPSFAFDHETVERFLTDVRDRVAGPVAFEPRHASWFVAEVEALLAAFCVGRVGADPAPVPEASRPGGWPGLKYCRLHGFPRVYYSSYADDAIRSALDSLLNGTVDGGQAWCIFDNTASGAATVNALTAKSLLI